MCHTPLFYDSLIPLHVQGSPLIPDDLRMVSASEAAAVCILSDTSRCGLNSQVSECGSHLGHRHCTCRCHGEPSWGHCMSGVKPP